MFKLQSVGQHLLVHGDCLDVLPLLSEVDMVFADLPYGTTQCRWDTVIPLDEMWQKLTSVRRDNTPVIMTAQTPFDKILGVSNIKQLKYEWIYEKPHATGHLNAKRLPLKAHENILVFYRKPPLYNPQKTNGHKAANMFTKYNDNNECYGARKTVSGGGQTDRYPRSVQTFKSDKQKKSLHPTQKPVGLLEYLIKTYTNEGDIVLDFVMGSGTTGEACMKTGRNFIGIEKDADYFNCALDRMRLLHGQA